MTLQAVLENQARTNNPAQRRCLLWMSSALGNLSAVSPQDSTCSRGTTCMAPRWGLRTRPNMHNRRCGWQLQTLTFQDMQLAPGAENLTDHQTPAHPLPHSSRQQ
eukprot:594710-Rhodomonas_salina.2